MPRSRASTRPSTIPATGRPYHHGDLRRALLDASLVILREQGPDALTIRGVARAAGVSQAAPYRHFADRTALVAGVAEDGFRRLFARMHHAVAAPPAPGETERAGLQRLALEYLRFALEHPAEYRIMFGSVLAGAHAENDASSPLPASFVEARTSVFGLLRGGIAQLQARGMVRAGDPSAMALSAWALMHGLAMLTLDGQVARAGETPPEELAVAATNLMMFGMDAGR